jgi:hypothetical protein
MATFGERSAPPRRAVADWPSSRHPPRTKRLGRCHSRCVVAGATFERRAGDRVNDVRSNLLESVFSSRASLFDVWPPRGRNSALRPSIVLLLVGVTLWSPRWRASGQTSHGWCSRHAARVTNGQSRVRVSLS